MLREQWKARRLGRRVEALLSQVDSAMASESTRRLEATRDEAWQFQKELFWMVAEDKGPPLAAAALFDVARVALVLELSASDWRRATAAGGALATALSVLQAQRGDVLDEDFLAWVRHTSEVIAYAAHRAGTPVTATLAVETLSSVLLGNRMLRHAIEGIASASALPELRRLVQSQRELLSEINGRPWPLTTEWDGLPLLAENEFRRDARELAARGHADPYPLLGPSTYVTFAQQLSGRTVVYLAPGPAGGCAIRHYCEDPGRAESVELPALTLRAVEEESRALDDLFPPQRRAPLPRHRLAESLQASLNRIGMWCWTPVFEAWPELLEQPLTIVPLGQASKLPYYTATFQDRPVCAQVDVSVAPSARALALSASVQQAAEQEVLVAADSWFGSAHIPLAAEEARAIAVLHRTTPVLFSAGSKGRYGAPVGPRPPQAAEEPQSDKFIALFERASLIHLACHGTYEPSTPLATALLLGQPRRLHELLARDLNGPLVVLSGCQLARVGENLPGEQLGFPAALLSMGARGVIGALWPVPDHDDTVDLMRQLHEGLASGTPPSLALGEAITRQHAGGVPATVWGSFAYYGG